MTDFSKTLINFDTFKVRCSAIGRLTSEPKNGIYITDKQLEEITCLEEKEKLTVKQGERLAELILKRENSSKIVLSDTCIEYLMEEYSYIVYGMIPVGKESMDMLAMKKGVLAENDAVTLLSIVDGEIYRIHKERIYNDFLSGEIDCYLGEHIYTATNVTDIKNAFDMPTYLKKINRPIITEQKHQVCGYLDITGAPVGYVAECLVSAPLEVLEGTKWKLAQKMGATTIESPEFLLEWLLFEKSMIFDHISPMQRVFKKKVDPFEETFRQKLYDKVKYSRDWLNEFHEKFQKLNISSYLSVQ